MNKTILQPDSLAFESHNIFELQTLAGIIFGMVFHLLGGYKQWQMCGYKNDLETPLRVKSIPPNLRNAFLKASGFWVTQIHPKSKSCMREW